MAYDHDCSQICRITSHIRACGPSSGVAVALEPSRITTLSSPPPASQAKIIVNLLAGHVHLAAASHSNNSICTCNYCQQQCSCLVCSIASLYCPTQFAYLPVRCLISPRLAYRPSCARPYHTWSSWYPVLAGCPSPIDGANFGPGERATLIPRSTYSLLHILPKATPRCRRSICHAPSVPHSTSPPPYTQSPRQPMTAPL